MHERYQPIAELLQRVRVRWQRLVLLRALMRAGLAAAAVLTAVLLVLRTLPPSPLELSAVAGVGALAALVVIVVMLRPIRQRPTDTTLARFIEERHELLDERLVSAVDVVSRPTDQQPAFAAAMISDAAARIQSIDPAAIVSAESIRRAGFQAAAAIVAVIAVLFAGRHVIRRAADATTLALFPSSVTLEVTPGDARIEAGTGLEIHAHLVGSAAPVVPQLQRAASGEDEWRAVEMQPATDGSFVLGLSRLMSSFQYRVVAGGATSKTFNVSVVRAPRVASIDVDYIYPKAFGLAPRSEKDGGDIYGPAGTSVAITVHADEPTASGQMMLADQSSVTLTPAADGRTLRGELTIQKDGSYRVALADAHGLGSHGDTEYFIRTMDDRPPEVHVTKPAGDRRVTPLEEVQVDAEAADDFGVASLELVYAIRGGKEQVVPLRIPPQQTTVNGSHVLYLEDLDVRPGDFVSYYVRARDVARGRRSVEARSDIFFLEIKHFEEEFSLAQSQAAMGGGASNPQLDELVAAQKEVIVATWKLDRRSQDSHAQSTQDIKAVANAETELKQRVERMASSMRTSTMRDPRARVPGRGGQRGQPAPTASAAATDPMTAAAAAMTAAATELNALKTTTAIPPEMEALNRLLEAQADLRRREVMRQQAGAGSAGNRNIQDLSSLFDRELARHQETNYENRSSSQSRQEQQADAADKIRDLAKRQDELLRRQQDLAARRQQMSAADVKRELEQLTREQNDLRERAEEVAQEIARRQNQAGQNSEQSARQNPQSGQQSAQQQQEQGGQSSQGQQSQGQQNASPNGSPSQNGQRQPTGGQPQSGAQAQSAQSGQSGREGGPTGRASEGERRLRAATDEMRASAGELRRESPEQAAARGQRALDELRALQQQLDSGSAEGRRRALGDMQLEARQLADAQRQLADEQRRAAQNAGGNANADTMRRLAGEQERLADRLTSLQQRLQSQTQPGAGAAGGESKDMQAAAADAGREIQRQRLGERMQQSAEAMRQRAATGRVDNNAGPSASPGQSPQANGARSGQGTPQAQDEIARALDRVADQMNSGSRSRDAEAARLSAQRARAQDLRERLNDITARLAELDRQASQQGAAGGRGQQAGRTEGRVPGAQNPSGIPGSSPATESSQSLSQLRDEMNQQLAELRQLLGESGPANGQQRGNTGATFEGQGMVLSAPGTEGFKQDFARWQELKRQATSALESIESAASKRLQARDSQDRLSTAADDRPPAEYQPQVDSYFRALASKKQP